MWHQHRILDTGQCLGFTPSHQVALPFITPGIDGRADRCHACKHTRQPDLACLGYQWPFNLLGHRLQLLPLCISPRSECNKRRRVRGRFGWRLSVKHQVGFSCRRRSIHVNRFVQVCSIGTSIQTWGLSPRMAHASLSMPARMGKLVVSGCSSSHRLLWTASPEAKVSSWLC